MNNLPDWLVLAMQLAAILVVAVAAVIAVRLGAAAAVRQLLRRDAASGNGVLPSADLERRVRTIEHLGVRAVSVAIVAVAGLMALDRVGLNIGPAVAGLGVVAIAVGLGAQALVKDWLAGIFVVLENQYSRGDVVQIAGVDGVVEDFSLRRTVLRDGNGTVHSVPNGLVGVASNLTRVWARVNLNVSVTYQTDIEAASRLIDRIGEEMQSDAEWSGRLLEAPAVVRIDSLGDNGITLKVMGQVRAAEQWAVAGELRKRILAGFRANDITIAFPHSVVVNPPASPTVAVQTPVAAPPSPEPAEPSDEEAGP
jgi:moderate conductance mechanosensitive channel